MPPPAPTTGDKTTENASSRQVETNSPFVLPAGNTTPNLDLGTLDFSEGSINWPYTCAPGSNIASPAVVEIEQPLPKEPPNTAVSPVAVQSANIQGMSSIQQPPKPIQPSDNKRITYQYALRYAMLLDAENEQLARSRSTDSNRPANASKGSNNSQQDEIMNRDFTVKSIGTASGTPNRSNRTPTLIYPNNKTGSGGGGGGNPPALSPSQGGFKLAAFRSKGWRNSLAELGDNAARKLKTEGSGISGRFKQLALGSNHNRISSASATAADGGHSKRNSIGATKDGAISLEIIKALAQQLKTSSGSASIHPITKDCYVQLYNYLRIKENSETLAEHGTMGDLIDIFGQLSNSVCAQHGISSTGAVTRTINSQLERFVKLLRTMLQEKSRTSREAGLALLKLDDYYDIHVDEQSGGRSRAISDASNKFSGQNIGGGGDVQQHMSRRITESTVTTRREAANKAEKQSICSWLQNVFRVPDEEHRQLLAELKDEVDPETAAYDLRTYLLVLKKDHSFAGKPEDFRTEQAYRIWKEREITSIEQLIHTFAMRQSFISGERITAGRLRLEASAVESMDDQEIAAAFEYIPAQAAEHFRLLVDNAVTHDIVSKYSPETTTTENDILASRSTVLQLSNFAKELLKQLSIAWRISAAYRETCYLDSINEYYEQGVLPPSYLIDAFGKIERIIGLMNPAEWPIPQYDYLVDVESRIEYHTMGCVQDVVEELDQRKPENNVYLQRILRALVINDASCPIVLNKPMPNISGKREEIVSMLEPSITYRCECLTQQCFGDESARSARDLEQFAQLAVLLLQDHDRCMKIFSMPLLQDGDHRYDIAGIVAEIETAYIYASLGRHIDQFGYNLADSDIETTLELCKLIAKIEELHQKYSNKPLTGIDNRRLFKETVGVWLKNIDNLKAGWVENAINQDSSPQGLNIGKHSTSIIDLVSCFSQQVSIVKRLHWPYIDTKAWFMTEFMKYVDISFKVYATVMHKQFITYMGLPTDMDDPKSPGWNSLWNSRKYKEQSLNLGASAQAAISKLDQSQAVEVNAHACIRINNVAIALERLYELQKDLGVHETMEELGGENRPSINGPLPNTFLLSFRVIRAESLDLSIQPHNPSESPSKLAQPYVKLAMTRKTDNDLFKRTTFGKTRAATSGTANPRWNESFDLHIDSREEFTAPVEARICTRDGPKRLGYREKTRARAFFAPPSPASFGVDGSVDIVLDLEPVGHLLLQVTMDGERNDPEFYSGRMFRFLERTLSDMQHRIVEQVSEPIREYLRQILVTRPARYRTSKIMGPAHAVGIERGIERSIQFLKHGGHQQPATIRVTQESCCEVLIPLIDYLENNLHILFVHLYESTANGVICKVWNEILVSLEDILLPPLHGASKGMAKPLTEADLSNIFDCIDFLRWYFEGGADGDGIPKEMLDTRKYRELLAIRNMYFMTSKELIDEYMKEMRSSATATTDSSTEKQEELLIEADKDEDTSLPLPPAVVEFSRRHSQTSSMPSSAFEQSKGRSPSSRPISTQSTQQQRPPPPPPPIPPRKQSTDPTRQDPPSLPERQRSSNLPPINTSKPERSNAIELAAELEALKKGSQPFSDYGENINNSSVESLSTLSNQGIKAAIVPAPTVAVKQKSGLTRSRSVWAHKNAETLKKFKREDRMVTDKGDMALRLLRLRFDKEAMKFVETQLSLRSQQMQYEVRRAAAKR